MTTAAIIRMRAGEGADIPLKGVEIASYLVLLVLAGAAWLLASPLAAVSALIGGFVVILSFQWLKRDSLRLAADPSRGAKIKFMFKCLGRLVLLGLLFYFLVRYQRLHIPGFLVGLATVQLGITLTTIIRAKRLLA